MNVVEVLNGVKVIEPTIFKDDRGYFFESFNDNDFRKNVCNTTFVQDNESKSCKGTLRGLHWQMPPFDQSKLVRCVQGAVFDVAVDIRKNSPTFLQWVGVELTAENHKQLFIPRGFAHGFVALEDNTIFQYKCDNLYNKASEAALRWDSVGIDWPSMENYILSDKDKVNPTIDEIDKNKLFNFTVR